MNIPDKPIAQESVSSDKKLSFFVIAYYFIHALNITIKVIIPMSEVVWQSISNVFMVILIVVMIFTISSVIKRSLLTFFVIESFAIVLYCISLLQGNANMSLLMGKAFQTLCVCIPMGLYVFSIKEKKVLYTMILKSSYILIPMLSLTYFMHHEFSRDYNMSVSYALMIPTMFFINEFAKSDKYHHLAFSSLGFVIILLYGARGPLVCILTMVLIRLLRFKKRSIRYVGLMILVSVVCGLVLVNYYQIANAIENFLAIRGIYSRTLSLITSGRFLHASGRDMLFNYYWNLILEKPLLGWGLVGGWIKIGSGPHNAVFELLLAFGLIGGTLMSLFLINIMFRSLFLGKGILGELLLIYASASIVLFFVSGDILTNPNLFILVLLYYSYSRTVNRNVHDSNLNSI